MSTQSLDTQSRPSSITFSPKLAAVVCADSTLRLFSMPDGGARRTFKLEDRYLDAVALSPDGTMVAIGSHSGQYIVWNAATGATIMQLRLPYYAAAIAFSPDSKRIAIAPANEPVQIYDLSSGSKLLELHRPPGGTFAVAFSPDGSRIVTGDADTLVRVYNSGNGELLARNSDFLLIPLAAAFTPDGKQILSGGPDKHIAFVDSSTGKVLRKSAKLADPVAYLEVSPNGSLAAAALMHADNLRVPAPILIFETATAKQVSEWLPPQRAIGCGWASDNRLLAAIPAEKSVSLSRNL